MRLAFSWIAPIPHIAQYLCLNIFYCTHFEVSKMLRYINMQFLTPEIQYKMFKFNFGKITNFVKKSEKYFFPLTNKITVKIIVNYYLFSKVTLGIEFFWNVSRKLIWIWSSKCSIIWTQNVAKLWKMA